MLKKTKIQGMSIEKAWIGDAPKPVPDEPEFWTILKTPPPKLPRQLSAQWTVTMPKEFDVWCDPKMEEKIAAIITKKIADEIDAEVLRSLK